MYRLLTTFAGGVGLLAVLAATITMAGTDGEFIAEGEFAGQLAETDDEFIANAEFEGQVERLKNPGVDALRKRRRLLDAIGSPATHEQADRITERNVDARYE